MSVRVKLPFLGLHCCLRDKVQVCMPSHPFVAATLWLSSAENFPRMLCQTATPVQGLPLSDQRATCGKSQAFLCHLIFVLRYFEDVSPSY